MSSGADLFVVCRHCGSEVSPYITECPYCGHRLRRRAPKLPRAGSRTGTAAPRRLGKLALAPRRWRGGAAVGLHEGMLAGTRPYATILLVAVGCATWIAWHAEPLVFAKAAIIGPLHHEWWRLFSSAFVYGNGIYAFAALVTIALFGWLLERRHGPVIVLALFLGASATGGLVASAVYPFPLSSGGNAGALALLAAWAAPEWRARERGPYDDADLLGAAAMAAVLLAMPFAVYGVSWLAGVTGLVLGALVGLGLRRMQEAEL